jgi:hypothetical protein
VLYLLRQREPVSASVVAAWVGASLANVALYIADARAQDLALLGGENVIHDWWYLLTEWGLLDHDLTIAGWVRLAGALFFVLAVLGTGLVAWRAAPVTIPLNRPVRERH